MYLDEAPDLLRRAGIELLLVDQVEPAGASVAEKLGIPFVTLSNALVTNEEPGIPPVFTTWPYSTSVAARLRNRVAYRFLATLTKPWRDAINARRREWKLPEYRTIWDSCSPTAHISQLPGCFDFPRLQLPPQFHYMGPWHDRNVRPEIPFPYERLTGRRLIYASMGTLQNRVREVFREIAEACNGIDAQLVVSLGGGSTPQQVGPLPGNPIVVQMAPQLELLIRATLVITHAGLNTALESLSFLVSRWLRFLSATINRE
jgi:UDP:flavonoid glycosyltransferase YjiC (YdhE family)